MVIQAVLQRPLQDISDTTTSSQLLTNLKPVSYLNLWAVINGDCNPGVVLHMAIKVPSIFFLFL